MIDKAIFISVAALTFLVGIFLTFKGFDMWEIHPNNVVFWVIISSWAIAGFIVGYCFIALMQIGLLILAAVAGVILSHLITSAVLIRDHRVYWGIIGGTAGAAMVLTCCCKEMIKILLTSLIGSFGVVRGISLYLGGFPNEVELQEQLRTGYITWESFPKTYYLYCLAYIGLVILSVVHQYWNYKHHEKRRNDNSSSVAARQSTKSNQPKSNAIN